MMTRFLYWLCGKRPARLISGEDGAPYMERYYLCSLGTLRAYLHRFVASDPDRGLHDHPWRQSASLLLSGNYVELREESTRFLRAGNINLIKGGDRHRILLPPGKTAWTVFVHGKRVKGWGFFRDGVYTPFARHKDDYPAEGWWKTAPRGSALAGRAPR